MRKALVALTLGFLTVSAAAGAAINLRQVNQERRIDAGVRSGKLTKHEAARLRAQQHAINVQEQRMRARNGGHLTKRDEQVLHARQRQADNAIIGQKYDSQHGRNHLKM